VQIIKQAAEKARIARPEKSRRSDAFRHDVQDRHGDIAYDKKGDRTTVDYVWYVWKKDDDGKITFKQL